MIQAIASRWRLLAPVILVVGFAGVWAAVNWWPQIGLFYAIVTAERRPASLADAKWNDPGSARIFSTQFHAGVSTTDLTRWLADERFVIDLRHSHAERQIDSLPCAERIVVDWRDKAGRLTQAIAKVNETGCL